MPRLDPSRAAPGSDHRSGLRSLVATLVLAVASSLALGDGRVRAAQPLQGAPPMVPPSGEQAAAEPLEQPDRPPDMDAGRALYAERCASCHGPTGRADGEMVAGLPAPPPSLAVLSTVHERAPAEAYDIITNGRLEQLMPPWRDALSVEERWDALAGSWSWSLTPTRLARGRAAWARDCAGCHGEDGDGVDGLPLGGLERSIERSTVELLAATRGVGEAHAALEEAEDDTLLLALDHLRALPFRHDSTDAVTLEGRLSGRVVAGGGSEEAVDVSRATVEAQPFAAGVPGETRQLALDGDGAFDVDGLPHGPDVRWVLVAEFDGVRYALPEAVAAEGGPVELVVYAPDPGAPVGLFSLRSMISPRPDRGVAEVFERWVVVNTSDRARVASDEGSASLRLPLPVGAREPQVLDGRLRGSARVEEDVLLLSEPVPPGEHEVFMSYLIPYAGQELNLVRRLESRVGEVSLVVSDPEVRIESAVLDAREPTTFEGRTLERLVGRWLEADSVIDARISGLPEAMGSPQMALAPLPPPPVSQRTLSLLALALATLASMLALVAPWAMGRGLMVDRSSSTYTRPPALRRALRRLADLERRNRAGDLSPKAYAKRRAQLLERTLALAPTHPSSERDGRRRSTDPAGARE